MLNFWVTAEDHCHEVVATPFNVTGAASYKDDTGNRPEVDLRNAVTPTT